MNCHKSNKALLTNKGDNILAPRQSARFISKNNTRIFAHYVNCNFSGAYQNSSKVIRNSSLYGFVQLTHGSRQDSRFSPNTMKRMASSATPEEYQEAMAKVTLVERNPCPNGTQIVSLYRSGRREAEDIVELAKEIQSAEIQVKNNACAKLLVIAEQVKFLQEQARKILEETQSAQDLHQAACNFKKIPGHIYHLYKRDSGQTYFSMLSPEEWGTGGCGHAYQGSYRLEHDQTWTAVEKLQEVSNNLKWARSLVDASGTKRADLLSIGSVASSEALEMFDADFFTTGTDAELIEPSTPELPEPDCCCCYPHKNMESLEFHVFRDIFPQRSC